jgi:hypothetical protein
LEENDFFLKYSCQKIGEKVLYSALSHSSCVYVLKMSVTDL